MTGSGDLDRDSLQPDARPNTSPGPAGEALMPDAVGAELVPDPRGEALVAELKWVHGLIRRDLRAVRQLAEDLGDGLPGPAAAAAIDELAIGSPLWRLKINCLHYCRFVHSHHHAESALLFPRLRLANPALGPVIDKLEADHSRVSDLLDDVAAAAMELSAQENPATRKRLIDALLDLSADLLTHLDYEEEKVSDTLRSLTGWAEW